jgi:hypothetical protein
MMLLAVAHLAALSYRAQTLTLPTAPTGINCIPQNGGSACPDANSRIEQLGNFLVNLLISIAIPVAVIGIIVTAFKLLNAKGDPSGYKVVRQNITYLLIGFFLIAFAVVGVTLVVRGVRGFQ